MKTLLSPMRHSVLARPVFRRWPRLVCLTLLAAVLALVFSPQQANAETAGARAQRAKAWRAENPVWRGVHLAVNSDAEADALGEALPHLRSVGVNVVVAEVNYQFEFKSHPELRGLSFVSKARAQALAGVGRSLDIRLIPELNCLGHQSWKQSTAPLLTRHPEFDETPGQFPGNKDIYCRSWCPQHPGVNPVVFALIDELVEGFGANAFHVGMDEVFLIASEHCPRCKGGDPAKLFAKAITDLHGHLVGKRKLEMLMWGDRLLDAKALGYSEWEAAKNGTAGALALIPKDIVICDWHYGKQEKYPSVPWLLGQGFQVWPSGWQPLEATKAFSDFALQEKNPRLLGYLCTTWGKVPITGVAEWPPVMQVLHDWESR
jgi:hypothetical protein